MDKFSSAKGAFAQARALAESGRSQVTKQFDKIDSRYPMGGQKANAAGTPTDENPHPLPTSHSSAPPPPPSRFGGGGGGPPPPPARGRSTSSVTGAGIAAGGAAPQGVFTNMSVTEKEAFFALLDEYFSSRPHLSHLFQSTNSSVAPPPFAPPVAPVTSRPAPPPARRGIGTAVALYDFEAGQGEDLPFREGDRIEVLEVVSDDWYKGALNGREGIFPAAYVQMEG
ncbi:hypothetical protein JCM11251_005246 [Rhodosporidiobolus azoricus]